MYTACGLNIVLVGVGRPIQGGRRANHGNQCAVRQELAGARRTLGTAGISDLELTAGKYTMCLAEKLEVPSNNVRFMMIAVWYRISPPCVLAVCGRVVSLCVCLSVNVSL